MRRAPSRFATLRRAIFKRLTRLAVDGRHSVTRRWTHQIAALPMRLGAEGKPEVLLVTSRETRRWIIPKGWPMKGLKDHQAAAVEAREEAGVKGRVLRTQIGDYTYWRRTRHDFRLTRVDVFLLRVDKHLKRWKEKGQRDIRWAGILEAADLVMEPELSTVIVRLPVNETAMAFLAQ